MDNGGFYISPKISFSDISSMIKHYHSEYSSGFSEWCLMTFIQSNVTLPFGYVCSDSFCDLMSQAFTPKLYPSQRKLTHIRLLPIWKEINPDEVVKNQLLQMCWMGISSNFHIHFLCKITECSTKTEKKNRNRKGVEMDNKWKYGLPLVLLFQTVTQWWLEPLSQSWLGARSHHLSDEWTNLVTRLLLRSWL